MKKKVLFVCIHNSARSQMAEAYLNSIAGDIFDAESAGLTPGVLNPLAVAVMKEEGLDISSNSTDSVFDFFKEGRRYNYVITVCDEAQAQKCPIFPNTLQTINWSFPDPAALKGSYEVNLSQTRVIRDTIKAKIKDFINERKGEYDSLKP